MAKIGLREDIINFLGNYYGLSSNHKRLCRFVFDYKFPWDASVDLLSFIGMFFYNDECFTSSAITSELMSKFGFSIDDISKNECYSIKLRIVFKNFLRASVEREDIFEPELKSIISTFLKKFDCNVLDEHNKHSVCKFQEFIDYFDEVACEFKCKKDKLLILFFYLVFALGFEYGFPRLSTSNGYVSKSEENVVNFKKELQLPLLTFTMLLI